MTENDSVPEIRVTAVVVTYNPDFKQLTNLINGLASCIESIVVVDNNSRHQEQLKTLNSSAVQLLALPANLGLAAAHNLGIKHAQSINSTHVLILDQDSQPNQHMIESLTNAAKDLEQKGIKYSGVGSSYQLDDTQRSDSIFVRISWFRFSRVSCDSKSTVKVDFLISSGALIPLEAIRQVGLMDESLFIDHVDTEWFLRAAAKGYAAYGCCNAVMNHSLGEKITKIWMGRYRYVPYHQPFRYYYIFRNSFLLYKRQYMPFKWMLADWVRLAQNVVFFGVLSENRFSNLKMMIKGFSDGLKGIAGRNDNLLIDSK